MSEPLYKTLADVEYLDEHVTEAVLAKAAELLSNFPVLAHDLNQVGLAMQLHTDELCQQYPADIPDDIVLDLQRQLYTHYIASLVSALFAMIQAVKRARDGELNKRILDANGEPLDLFKR